MKIVIVKPRAANETVYSSEDFSINYLNADQISIRTSFTGPNQLFVEFSRRDVMRFASIAETMTLRRQQLLDAKAERDSRHYKIDHNMDVKETEFWFRMKKFNSKPADRIQAFEEEPAPGCDIHNRPYAKIAEVSVGTKVIVDDGFPGCFLPWSELEVVSIDGNLALYHNVPECGACGGTLDDEPCPHVIDTQIDSTDTFYIGIYLASTFIRRENEHGQK